MGAPQLAKQHRDKLIPTAKASRMPLGFGLSHCLLKFVTGK
jgi:hypothetical protein